MDYSSASHRGRCQEVGASASNKYFIFMLAPLCGLMHNVTSAVSLQVQHVVTSLHFFKYTVIVYSMCVSTSVTKSNVLS